MFRDRTRREPHTEPLRMVLDDETVDRLRADAIAYGLEVEELIVALIQAASDRVHDLLGDPPGRQSGSG